MFGCGKNKDALGAVFVGSSAGMRGFPQTHAAFGKAKPSGYGKTGIIWGAAKIKSFVFADKDKAEKTKRGGNTEGRAAPYGERVCRGNTV